MVEPVTTAEPIGPTMDESATDVETGTEVGFVVEVDVMVPVAPAPEEDAPADPDEPPPVAVNIAVESVSVPPAAGLEATDVAVVCNKTLVIAASAYKWNVRRS